MRKLLVRSGFAGLIAASFLVGAPAAFAEMVMYKATLAAASEVPPTDSKGSGALTASYDTATKKLTYSATYKDLTGPATAAHFHGPADAKTNAGVVVEVGGKRRNGEPAQGRSHPDRRAGGRPCRRQVVLQHPHRGQQGRRDPRPGHEVVAMQRMPARGVFNSSRSTAFSQRLPLRDLLFAV
jgi:CHRD domain